MLRWEAEWVTVLLLGMINQADTSLSGVWSHGLGGSCLQHLFAIWATTVLVQLGCVAGHRHMGKCHCKGWSSLCWSLSPLDVHLHPATRHSIWHGTFVDVSSLRFWESKPKLWAGCSTVAKKLEQPKCTKSRSGLTGFQATTWQSLYWVQLCKVPPWLNTLYIMHTTPLYGPYGWNMLR